MRVLWAFLGLAALASASTLENIGYDQSQGSITQKDKQILLLKLLNHVTQPCMYKDIEEYGRQYKIEENMDKYTKIDVVKRFINNYHVGFLPRGEIFTLHVERQIKEVIDMFNVLFYAKDFTTFFKTACWMRLNVNEGMFVYALTVAVRHRDDCRGIVLPPPYEIYPYFFVRADVIQKAYMLKMQKGTIDSKLCDFYGIKKTEKNVYVIDENIYDTRVYLNDNDNLRYFTEDIGLNTYYYYFHVDYPFWMNELNMMDRFKARRYELTLYFYQQILARYNLERLSNNMGDIRTLSWDKPVENGFWPYLRHHTGVELPVRFNNYIARRDDNVDMLQLVEDYEIIIKDAVLKGYIITHDGVRLDLRKQEDIENLGNIIYSKVDKYHGDLYRYLIILMKSVLGLNAFTADKYFVVPTVLDHYQTALRDPVFYNLQKRIVDILFLFKKKLPSYTREDLYFPGVKVENIVIDKLVTYFDDYFMDMTNALYLNEEELRKTKSDMTFLVRKRRLNHKPFKLNLEIMSDKAIDSVIRIFLGPKYDHMDRLIDINKNRMNFVEIDSFVHKLNTGKNVVIRDCKDMHNMVHDRIMTRDFWSKLESSGDIREFVTTDMKNYQTGFPLRLLLPKGHVGGMKMMMYVIVTPLKIVDNVDLTMITDKSRYEYMDYRYATLMDKMPLGFPLDRHIDVSTFFTTNMKFVDVMIFHQRSACDMRTRWERYVLRNYNLESTTSDDYFVPYNNNINHNNIVMNKQDPHLDF